MSAKRMLRAGRLARSGESSVRRQAEVEIFQRQRDQLWALIGLQHWLSQLDAVKEQSRIYWCFAYLQGGEVPNAQCCAAIRLQQGQTMPDEEQ